MDRVLYLLHFENNISIVFYIYLVQSTYSLVFVSFKKFRFNEVKKSRTNRDVISLTYIPIIFSFPRQCMTLVVFLTYISRLHFLVSSKKLQTNGDVISHLHISRLICFLVSPKKPRTNGDAISHLYYYPRYFPFFCKHIKTFSCIFKIFNLTFFFFLIT